MTSQPYGSNRYNPTPSNRWQDWVNVLLAIWLFFSPWILQFGNVAAAEPVTGGATSQAATNAAWNAWVLGVIVFLIAVSAISRMELWQEWLNLLLGAWIFVAPWVLGFATGSYPAAAWDHWIVGALVFIVSATSLSRPPFRPVSTRPHGGEALRR